MPDTMFEEPTDVLLAGRRALEGIAGVELIEDYVWYPEKKRWVLHLRLKPEVRPSGLIPKESDWYVLLEELYPWGSIIFYPAQDRGITQTFPHQNFNDEPEPGLPWRRGRLCVDTSVHSLGRSGYDIEPFGADDRLKWHVFRALDWLKEASFERLTLPGEPFELPDFRPNSNLTIAFNESPEMLQTWQAISKTKGYANISIIEDASETAIINQFQSLKDYELIALSWGLILSGMRENGLVAGWIRLNQVPFLEPYRAPKTWGELKQVCNAQDIDIHERIMSIAPRFRDGHPHILLFGFPIPQKAGEQPHQMHWLALKLPVLSWGSNQGFENNERGWRLRDEHVVLRDSIKLEWYDTENWSPRELSGRGVLPETVTNKTIAVIGAGAIGSAISELLVRAGTYNLVILDDETLEAGNLVRHTLTIKSLGKNKAKELAERLNKVSPHAKIEALSKTFPPTTPVDIAIVHKAHIIIDCTGSDVVLEQLKRFAWEEPKLFLSISLGLWAKRLFLFSVMTNEFPREQFVSMVNPWLRKEMSENAGRELPREGIGCWHPLFPARVDDIWLMAGVAVKYLEDTLNSLPLEPKLVVFEQVHDTTGFIGLRKVDLDQ